MRGLHALTLGPRRRVAVLAFAATAATAATAEAAPTGFQSGEGFAYNLSVGAIQAGQARMSVGVPSTANGKRVLMVQGDAKSADWMSLLAKLEDVYQAVLDPDTLTTRTVNVVEHGMRERTLGVVLERSGELAHVILDIAKPNQPKRHETHKMAGTPLDPMGALFNMRAAPLHDGDEFELLTFDGPAFYKTHVRAAGRVLLTRSGGEVSTCIRIEITATRVDDRGKPNGAPIRRGTIWFSDDDRRIPYKLAGDTDFGRAELDLVLYRPGKPPRLVPRRAQAAIAPVGTPPVRLE